MYKQKINIYRLATTAVGAAILAVIAPFSIPIGAIPVSLCTLVIYLMAYALGAKRSLVAVLVYLMLGAAGLPVFSGFSGGVGALAGPTGGFLIGYLPLAFICGAGVSRFADSRFAQLAVLALATAVLYALGTVWFCLQAHSGFISALGMCVLPFLPGDAAKLAVAASFGPKLSALLQKAHGTH